MQIAAPPGEIMFVGGTTGSVANSDVIMVPSTMTGGATYVLAVATKLLPIVLLICSNVFMTFAWYGHLKYKSVPLITVVLISWAIAFVEYCFAVPANRLGSDVYSPAQLKTMQEVITLVVFADVVRSNIAVGRIVLHRGTRNQTSDFVNIPLALTNPVGLAALACIITACPGTTWARYDSTANVLTMHILDLVDEQAWIDTIKQRYESRLLEIFR